MKVPKRLEPLLQDGLIDEVLGQLMSGKESEVFLVRCGRETRCAKVYKEIQHRSFHKQTQYTEGRKVRNSRRSRAMGKHSRFGRKEQEEVWQNAEGDALRNLAAAGVRVVLIMELVVDGDGAVAPRLNDLGLSETQARDYHHLLIDQVVLMLCAGLIHGDLSEFNILLAGDGPVIIDLPQVIDAAANNNAKRLFTRDVDNLATYFGQFAPELLATDFAAEIWHLYETGDLQPGMPLSGQFKLIETAVDEGLIIREIDDAREEAMARF
jgi:RIO kinase 1